MISASSEPADQTDNLFRHRIKVAAEGGCGKGADFVITDHASEYQRMALYKSSLVVLGARRTSALTASIIDIDRQRLVDFILYQDLYFSPSRRFLIYTRFVPRHAMPEGQGHVVMVYDLDRGPRENRPSLQLPQDRYSWIGWSMDAGTRVYPRDDSTTANELHLISSSYLWTEGEKKVAFLDMVEDDIWLVQCDLTAGLERARIKTRKVDLPDVKEVKQGNRVRWWDLELGKGNLVKILRPSGDGRLLAEVPMP